jgi:hypothetical protein
MLCPSIFFRLISSDNKDKTTSSNFKEIVLLPMAITKLSHEFGKEHNKLIHLSSSEILISTYTYRLTIVLNAFKCSATESPSLILRLYNLFLRNSLFTRDLDSYKFPNFSHKSLVVASSDRFSNTKSDRHSHIVLFAFRSNFFQSSAEVPVGVVPGYTAMH